MFHYKDKKINFDDVLIYPKPSRYNSRKEINLDTKITFPKSRLSWEGVPIMASNMDHVGTFSNPYDSELPSGLTNSDCNGQGQTSYTLGENNTLIMKTNFKNGEDCLISQMSLEWWK